jgi:site-specific DNA recombinase
MTRTVAYLRVSTDKQADAGVSLDAQRAKVDAYASLYDLDVVAVVVESESAKSLHREGLQRALAMLGREADALLVVKLDRLTRSVKDLGELVDGYFNNGKHALMSVAEQVDTRSAAGRLVLNVLASVAQWERETIGERTSEAMQHMRSCGEYTGGRAPYGYTLANGELTSDPFEQSVLTEAKALHAAGLSLRAVAADLDKRGLVARSGREFSAKQVQRLVA